MPKRGRVNRFRSARASRPAAALVAGRARRPSERLPEILCGMEDDPHWEEWLRLTPGKRLISSWRLRVRLKNPEEAHDERSLPFLG